MFRFLFGRDPQDFWQESDDDETTFDGSASEQSERGRGSRRHFDQHRKYWDRQRRHWGRHGRPPWPTPPGPMHFGWPFGPGMPFMGDPFGGDSFGGDSFDRGQPGRRRQRRGDIKYALLELLAEQPRHGYELIKELEQRYGGFYRPSPGSVYPTLQLLEDEGHLTSTAVDGKRVYTITDSGRQLLAERRPQQGRDDDAAWRQGFRRHASAELDDLRQSSMAATAGVFQVAHHGTPAQVRAVATLLDTLRRDIYAILAGTADAPASEE